MNFYPRSATVRAESDVVAYEMLRNVLDIMMKNKTFKAQIDETYRRRALENHLRGVPMFADLAPDFIEHLKETVELQRFAPGQAIARQGEAADSFYLVRIGFVKISEDYPGGELVLAYLSRGDYFGEIGLLGGGVRTANCTALDHVEVVRIPGEDFRQMVERFPTVRRGLELVAQERRFANQQRMEMVQGVPIDQFLSQGLMEAQSLLVLDLENCTRCDACVNACADAHDGVTRLVRDGFQALRQQACLMQVEQPWQQFSPRQIARGSIEGEAPRVAQAVGVHLRRRPALRRVDPKDLPQQGARVLGVVGRVVPRAAVAGPDVQEAVRPEHELTAVVVPVRRMLNREEDSPGGRVRSVGIGG